jgi:hypothetical protein
MPDKGTATNAIAIAETIEIFARWKRRIPGHLPVKSQRV